MFLMVVEILPSAGCYSEVSSFNWNRSSPLDVRGACIIFSYRVMFGRCPEGMIFFPDEPILKVTAPLIEAQLLETLLIHTIGLHTLTALPKKLGVAFMRDRKATKGEAVVNYCMFS